MRIKRARESYAALITSGSDSDPHFIPLNWEEFSRDLIVSHHFSQVIGVLQPARLRSPGFPAPLQGHELSVVVNLGRHDERLPCLIVDSSPEGFRLRVGLRLRRRQTIEVIPRDDPLNAVRCSAVWVGKAGSIQEGEVGLQAL